MKTFLTGALGAALVIGVLSGGIWLSNRYQEFVVMRQVVQAILVEAQRQAPKPEPVPSVEQ